MISLKCYDISYVNTPLKSYQFSVTSVKSVFITQNPPTAEYIIFGMKNKL